MSTKIFVNLPVADLPKSIAFFTELGYSFNTQFADETATCMVVSEAINVMLLTREKFREFSPKEICDTTTCNEVLLCLTCESRARVDELVARAVANGATTHEEPTDYGFMYSNSFMDLDGHAWNLMYMEPGAESCG
jgi:predicted lactoylglutathione lyase